ncbi:MAG: hypothetical protein ACJ8R9_03920 [Steroidobacteraceae bacterium]
MNGSLLGIAVVSVLILGPLLLRLAGLISGRQAALSAVADPPTAWNWKLTVSSALLYALAFNLTFFIQELFLVLPKALTPGLRPTLFHNNHSWEGDSPLASLFQGTGALAILITGFICALLLRRGSGRSPTATLFLIWMAYNGFFQSLPQVIVGAVNPGNDVGIAMDYLRFGTPLKMVMALVALVAIPPLALSLRRPLLSLAETPVLVVGSRGRTRFAFRVATLPALMGTLLIIPFRVPRDWIEVVVLPLVVTVVGVAWIQAGAWNVSGVRVGGRPAVRSLMYPLGALLVLFLVFQFVLRPGVRFY